MVIVLAVLHALHVMGGIIALALVTARAGLGRYDHERFWAIQFSAYYWHFLDLVWIVMLVAFWATSGGFVLT
jgi:cytochrome c oxidase subunit 3